MGQKTNPTLFRVITSERNFLTWYVRKLLYPGLLKEDFFVRKQINQAFKPAGPIAKINLARVGTSKKNSTILATTHSLFPRVKQISQHVFIHMQNFYENFEALSLLNITNPSLKFFINLTIKNIVRDFLISLHEAISTNCFLQILFIKNIFTNAVLIAKYVGHQVLKGVPFRRVLKQAIKYAKKSSIKGVKIQISGRLNGADIARTEWLQEGSAPLQSIFSPVSFAAKSVDTTYGVFGIKVWLFQ